MYVWALGGEYCFARFWELKCLGCGCMQVMEVEASPLFDDLLRQVCLGRKIGENPERIRAVAAQEERALRMTRQSREELQARQLQTHNPELESALVCCSLPNLCWRIPACRFFFHIYEACCEL